MANAITNEQKIQINELYAKYKTYAEVARQMGISPSTVKRYVMPDFTPASDLVLIHVDLAECRKTVENYYMSADMITQEGLMLLTEKEKEEIKELWKEVSL